MMKSVRDGQQVDAVVLDADMNLSLSKLIRAHLYLHNPECVLIVGATDMVFALDGECSVIGKYKICLINKRFILIRK